MLEVLGESEGYVVVLLGMLFDEIVLLDHVNEILRELLLFHNSVFQDIALSKSNPSCLFAERHFFQRQVVVEVESVGEEGVGRMVAGELFFEDEKVVHVVENAVEIRGQQVGFNYFDHF